MGFRLANVDGRAALVDGDRYFDLAELRSDPSRADPMVAITMSQHLTELSATLSQARADRTGLRGNTRPAGPPATEVVRRRPRLPSARRRGRHRGAEDTVVFTKFPSCLVGPTADVEIRSDFCDYEGELVVVIGTGGRDDAWDLGKSFDTFGPLGPVLESVDAAEDRHAMRIRTSVNGEIRQDDTTSNLMIDVPTLISYLSRITTLDAGDIIFTGTPDGIGAVSGTFLVDGDVITTSIDGIGTIENRCVRVSDHQDNDNQKEDH
jgi:2,4-diketo-3-deoxy-L-fuconate hydrolase